MKIQEGTPTGMVLSEDGSLMNWMGENYIRQPDQREVTRLRLPVPVRGMDTLSAYLEVAYGPDLTLRKEGDWLVVERPETQCIECGWRNGAHGDDCTAVR